MFQPKFFYDIANFVLLKPEELINDILKSLWKDSILEWSTSVDNILSPKTSWNLKECLIGSKETPFSGLWMHKLCLLQ